jgi:Cas7 group CRISPR-associated protein Csh2
MSVETRVKDHIVRATGLLVIEAVNSNPNGDPDRESDPRQRPDGRGEISPVSFKRKVRDLVADKDGPVWTEAARSFPTPLSPSEFDILETRGRNRSQIEQELKELAEIEEKGKGIKEAKFVMKYWDGRIFGNTFLEEGASTTIKTGVVQFGLGVSIAPVLVERMTNTNKAGVQEGKDRGMAPLGYRIVQHGVYCMPFFVNPTAAAKSGCTRPDVEVLLKVIPYAYSHTASYVRPFVGIRHAWYVEHKSRLGSCSDFALIAALTPKKSSDPEKPSKAWEEYHVPESSDLPEDLKNRIASIRDLVGSDDGTARA